MCRAKAVKRLVSENEEGAISMADQVPTKVFAKRLQDYIEERPGGANNATTSTTTTVVGVSEAMEME